MSVIKLERNPTLSEQLVAVIEQRIREGHYPAGSRLPSESELAADFGVSRATVRSALTALASAGRIIRRHGVGTYVSKLYSIANPINQVMEFHELISSGGFEPGVSVLGAELVLADDRDASNLSVEVGSRLISLRKVFTADGAPLIYVKTSLPESTLRDQFDKALVNPGITEPLFEFIERGCGRRVKKMIAWFWPETVQGCMAEAKIEIPNKASETPVLRMDYIAYNEGDSPLFESHQAYLGRSIKFTLLRSRISPA